MINAAGVMSEAGLAALLAELGFTSQPIPAGWQVLGEGDTGRLIEGEKNRLQGGPVIVAISEGTFDVYFYNWHEAYFNIWTVLAGDLPVEKLRQAILAAGAKDAMSRIYPTPPGPEPPDSPV